MPVYATLSSGNNLSQLITDIEGQHQAIMGMQRGTSEPTVKPIGSVWQRTNYPTLGDAWLIYDGATYNLLLDPDHPQINAGGTVAFGANQSLGNNKITNLAAGTADNDAVRRVQVILRDGTQAMTGNLNLGANRITNVGEPALATDAPRLGDTVGLNFYRTTGAAPNTIYSGWLPGTQDEYEVVNQTPFNPEKCRIVIKAQVRDAETTTERIALLQLDATIYRDRVEAGNGGVFTTFAGKFNNGSGWQDLFGDVDIATSADYLWKSQDLGNGVRMYVDFRGFSGTRGVVIWFRRNGDDGRFMELDEVGGPAEGVAQLFIWYGEFTE